MDRPAEKPSPVTIPVVIVMPERPRNGHARMVEERRGREAQGRMF
jgi:hypothetical protein